MVQDIEERMRGAEGEIIKLGERFAEQFKTVFNQLEMQEGMLKAIYTLQEQVSQMGKSMETVVLEMKSVCKDVDDVKYGPLVARKNRDFAIRSSLITAAGTTVVNLLILKLLFILKLIGAGATALTK